MYDGLRAGVRKRFLRNRLQRAVVFDPQPVIPGDYPFVIDEIIVLTRGRRHLFPIERDPPDDAARFRNTDGRDRPVGNRNTPLTGLYIESHSDRSVQRRDAAFDRSDPLRQMRGDQKSPESRQNRFHTEDLFGQPLGHSDAPRMRETRVTALIIDRSAVRGERIVPRRSINLEKSRSAVTQLSSPAIVDRSQRFGITSHPRHSLDHEILIERRIRQPLLTIRKSRPPQSLSFAGVRKTGIHGVRSRKNTERVVPTARIAQLPALFVDISAVLRRQVGTAAGIHRRGELVPCPDRQHLISILRFVAIRVLEPGAEPFVPAVKLQVGIRPVVGISDIQLFAGVVGQTVERLPVARIIIVIDQAQHPVKRITGDAVELRRGIIQVLFHEVVIAERHHRSGLRRMGVAGPRMTVAALHQDRPEILFQQVQLDGIGARVPDPGQRRIATTETAFVIGRLGLANQSDGGNRGRAAERPDVNPTVAYPFVKFRIQFQPVSIAVTHRHGRLVRMLRAGIQYGRFGIFADAHFDLSVQVVRIELQPAGADPAEVEHQVARAVDPDRRRLFPDPFHVLRPVDPDRNGSEQIGFETVGSTGVRPAVSNQRIGRLRHRFPGQNAAHGRIQAGYLLFGGKRDIPARDGRGEKYRRENKKSG